MRLQLFLSVFVVVGQGLGVWLDLELMCVLERSLIRILEVNHDSYRKLTVPSIMNLKRRLINGNKRLRKAVMDRELDLLY